MGLEFIEHNGIKYPKHEAIGGAALWIRPLAQYYCKGKGLDIGFSKPQWQLPGSIGIDECLGMRENAMDIYGDNFDYIHSSHMLEHLKGNWYDCLDYWLTKIKVGGIIFLYLPHKSQTYWQSISNRKHVHEFDGSEIGSHLESLGHKVFVGGCDANHSFVVVCEKVAKVEKTKEEYLRELINSI